MSSDIPTTDEHTYSSVSEPISVSVDQPQGRDAQGACVAGVVHLCVCVWGGVVKKQSTLSALSDFRDPVFGHI